MSRGHVVWLTLGALALGGIACKRSEPPEAKAAAQKRDVIPVATPSASNGAELLAAEERTWRFESTPVGPMHVVVLLPERRADARLPVLIAMHGRGEALKGPERGARGWLDDYTIRKTIDNLLRPPLSPAAFKSFVTKERLQRFNRALQEKPYRGLILVFPYTPDMLQGEEPIAKAPPLASFLVDELLPRVYRETPALGTKESTGIDGVSLGGRAAVSVGLLRPEAFGAIAGVQAALGREHALEIALLAQKARLKNSKLVFRLLTSTDDFFRDGNSAIAAAMSDAGVPVTLDLVPGPHDYDFNRGPGGIEMLLFHDRALRGEAPP
jgi:enterochelin esterase-like enzyme